MVYKEERNDVTKMPEKYVIAHCISCDCAMGAGVVVPIKRKHPGVKSACLKYVFVRNKELNLPALGTTFRYQDKAGIVYNMFSKRLVGYKAGLGVSYENYLATLEKCLISLKKQMIENNEKFLAMPKIACGLDRCKWSDVSPLIQKVFSDSDIEIMICLFD